MTHTGHVSSDGKIMISVVEYERLVRDLAEHVWQIWLQQLRYDRERRGL